MARGRAAVRMDEAEVAAFLGDNMKVQVASLGADGHPHLTTLFYVVDGGRIGFWTYATSQKVANLRRDPRLSALVEAGEEYAELRGVSVRGRAVISDDLAEVSRLGGLVTDAIAGGVDLGELRDAIVADQAPKRVAIWVEPEHIASWDHRKQRGVPGAGEAAR